MRQPIGQLTVHDGSRLVFSVPAYTEYDLQRQFVRAARLYQRMTIGVRRITQSVAEQVARAA